MTIAERVLLLQDRGYDTYRIAAVLGLDVVDVVAVLEGGNAPEGASSSVRVIACPFAFDTPGLSAGAEIFTPEAGDYLLDAWVQINTIWDGTTPLFDFSDFVGAGTGLYAMATQGPSQLNLSGPGESPVLDSPSMVANPSIQVRLGTFVIYQFNGCGLLPLHFVGQPSPLKVVVSQDGQAGGADPGSTQGAAVLNLLMVTPSGA